MKMVWNVNFSDVKKILSDKINLMKLLHRWLLNINIVTITQVFDFVVVGS